MADHDYSLLGSIVLDAGSWADWFSGTMSCAAVGAALLGYWFVHRQRGSDNKDREKRAAESVGWKALKVFNDTATVAKHLKESLAADVDLGFQPMKFTRVRPLGIPPKSTSDLNQEEIGFLLRAKASGILMELGDAIARYDSIRFSMEQYKARHEALYELMPPPVATEGTLFTHRLSKADKEKITPYAVMLDALLDSIIDLTAEGVEKSQAILMAYTEAMTSYFGKWNLKFEASGDIADLKVFQSMPWPKQG